MKYYGNRFMLPTRINNFEPCKLVRQTLLWDVVGSNEIDT
jgi:hypothetical protein